MQSLCGILDFIRLLDYRKFTFLFKSTKLNTRVNSYLDIASMGYAPHHHV